MSPTSRSRPVASRPGPSPKRSRPSARAVPSRDSTLAEAARTLLRAEGVVLLTSGTPRTVLWEGGLSEAQLADFLARIERDERFPQVIGRSLFVRVSLPESRLLGIAFGGRASLSKDDQRAIELFVELIASAGPQRQIENRRLLAVSSIQQSISAQSPLSEVFRVMYQRAAEEMDTPTFIAATYDTASRTALCVFAMQDGIERSPSDFPPRALAGPLADAIQSHKPQRIEDTARLSDAGRAAILGDGPRPVRSMLVVPMVHRDEVQGVIEAQSYRPGAFTDDDVDLLSTLASQATVALQSAQLLEESRRQVERLTLLNRVATATSRTTDLTAACRLALELILSSLPGIDMANAWIMDHDQPDLVRLASFGFSEGGNLHERLPLEANASASRVARTGCSQVLHVQAGGDIPAETRPFVALNQIETLIHIPMRTGQRVVGVLTLAASSHREIDPPEFEFLETLAGQLGAQLEAITLYERRDAERLRLQTIIENLPEAIVIADEAGRITIYNHTAEEIWGHPAQDATLEKLPQVYQLCTPDGRPLPWQETPLARSILQGEPSTGRELLVRRPDGSEVPVLSNCAPVRDSQGKISGSVEVFQDITRLKELDRLKDDFINTVSHELRTPTTTIRGGALTLLRRGDSLDERTKRQLLRDMSEEAERLHILVEDLLSLARSQAGMQLTTEPVIPHRFVNHMILDMAGRVGDHTLTVEVPANLPMVEADPFCLEQIFRNLLENAVKFSPRGNRIEITGAVDDDKVVFSILDRGSGIPAKDIDRVFEPFYRSDEVISAGAQGAGLGLAVCQRFAEMQGGRIWAEARPGGGTVFRFTVPSVGEPPDEDETDEYQGA